MPQASKTASRSEENDGVLLDKEQEAVVMTEEGGAGVDGGARVSGTKRAEEKQPTKVCAKGVLYYIPGTSFAALFRKSSLRLLALSRCPPDDGVGTREF